MKFIVDLEELRRTNLIIFKDGIPHLRSNGSINDPDVPLTEFKEPTVAYLLLENEEYADPIRQGITFSKDIAEAWKRKRPVSFDAVFWNSYIAIPIVK